MALKTFLTCTSWHISILPEKNKEQCGYSLLDCPQNPRELHQADEKKVAQNNEHKKENLKKNK